MSSNRTQMSAVLAWCERYGTITSKEAIDYLGITRLADTIYRIKKLPNYSVETTRKHVPSRYGGAYVACYTIKKTDISCQGNSEEDVAE